MLSAPAAAKDPGRWTLSGWSSVPVNYWQGVTTSSRPAGRSSSPGVFTGLHRTDRRLHQTGSVDPVIPPLVFATEGYNHVGDIGYQGGRVLLPLECYTPGGPNGGNTCGTGSFGVADPDDARVPVLREARPVRDPEGDVGRGLAGRQLLWTSSGPTCWRTAPPTSRGERGARRGADPLGAAPGRGRAAERGHGRGRSVAAGCFWPASQGTTYQVWSVNVATGARRLELELRNVQGESEGLTTVRLLGGRLHYLVAPLAAQPTFGPTVGLLHFATGRWAHRGLRVRRARETRRRSARA